MRHKRNLVFTLLFVSFIAALVIIAIPNVKTSPDTINVPGNYSTIQAAIDAASPGDTIIVHPATYDEQVVINKSLVIQGDGDTTIVKPSSAATLTQVFDGLFWYGTPNTKQIAGIIVANVPDGSNVTIKNLKVDGSSVTTKPAGADYLAGIFYRETGGTIDTVNIVGTGAWSGGDRAYGIYLSAATNTVSVQISGSTITNYDKNGIEAMGNKLTFSIHDNVLTGRGPTLAGDEVQNGIHAGRGGVGTVNNNMISNLVYQPEQWWAAGIMFYNYLTDEYGSGSVANNTITNCQIGVIFKNCNGTAQDNTVNGGTVGLLGLWAEPNKAGTWTASFVGNTVSGVRDDIYYNYDNGAIGAETYHAGASLTVTIDNNQLTGGGSTSADGIYIDGSAGTITTIIRGNVISGWQNGIHLVSSVDAGSISNNNITGTYLGILVQNATSTQICNNRIIDFVKGGIVTRGAKNILVEGNIISTTLHDVAPNGIDIGIYKGTNGTVKGNEISGCSWNGFTGDYETSWSGSGILVIESGDSLEIIGNVAHDCDVGMDIESDLMNITCNEVHNNVYGFVFWNAQPKVNYNNIYSNTQYGVFRTTMGNLTGVLDARYNWWGDASGPGGVGPGTGDNVSDYVDYTHWLDEEYTLTLTVTYPMEGAYLDSLAVIWVNGTITETSWMGRYPQINDTSFTLDLASWNGTYFAFYNTTAIADGIHSYIVNFTDLADITASDTVTFTIDTTPPVIIITYPTNGSYIKGAAIYINGTVTELRKDGNVPLINDTRFGLTFWNGTHFGFQNTTAAIPDGILSLKVNFTDSAGNTGEATVWFTVDNTPPVVTITSPVEGSYMKATVWINATVVEANPFGYEIKIADTSVHTGTGQVSWQWTTTAYTDGAYIINVTVTDSAGNVGWHAITVTLDNTPPEVQITYPSEGEYLDDVPVIWINGTVTEFNKGTAEPVINDTIRFGEHPIFWNGTHFAFKNQTVIADGSISVSVSFTDLAGNTGNDTVTFTLDTVYPVVNITYPSDGQYIDRVPTIWINGTVYERNVSDLLPFINDTDTFELYQFTWNSTTWIGEFSFKNKTVIPDGRHAYKVSFTDLAGKTGSDTVYFVLDTTLPIVNITYPTEGAYLNVPSLWVNGTVTELNMDALDPSVNDTRFARAYWNSTTGEFAFNNNTVISDGLISLTVSFTDLAVNTGSDSVTFTLDTTAPVVEITYPSDSEYVSAATLWVNGTVTEPNKNGLLPSINDTRFELAFWNTVTGIFGFKNNTAIADGPISVSVNFTNMAGNTSIDTVSFTIDTTAPIVTITSPLDGSYVRGTVWINSTIAETNPVNYVITINGTPVSSGSGQVSWQWDTTLYIDGTYIINVTATDAAGNVGSDTVTVIIDYTPPVKTIVSPVPSSYLNYSSFWINETLTDATSGINATSVTMTLNGTPVSWSYHETTGLLSYHAIGLADGNYTVIVTVQDLAGNLATNSWWFIVDTTPPVVEITYPTEGSYISVSSHLWINGTITELNMGGLEPAINDTRFDLTHWDSATDVFAFKNNTAIADGPVSVEVSFTDLAGNTGQDTISFILDTTAPTEPTDFAVTVVEGNSTFTWVASTDNLVLKGYYLELNGEIRYAGNVTSYTWPSLSAGGYTAWLWATDMAENNSTKTTLTFIVSQEADIIDVKCPAEVYKEQWFLLNATVENVGNITGIIFVNVSDTSGVLASDTVTLASGETSIVTFNLTAPTNPGSTTLNVTAGHDIIIDDYWVVTMEVLNRPPIALFTYSPEFPIANETVTFNASTSYDLDGTIDVYKWDFGDGTAIETSPTPTMTHVYETRGNYTVTLTVIDNEDSENKTEATITIIDYPTANFTYSPAYPFAGETVTFNASASAPNGGTIISYFWNFGDGMTANVTSEITTHVYLSFGNYTVMLTVKDSEGLTNSCSKVIAVIDYPTADFTYSLIYPIAGETVTFDASTSTPNGGTIVSYFWDFGDGTNATELVTSHIYDTFGTYTVTLKIVDSEELANSTSKPINVRQHPTANFTYSPPLPMVGESVTFNASLSEPNGGTIATYTWDFGDTQTGIGITANHTYSTYGTYNVTLTVTDTEGLSNTFTQTIRIIIEPTADFMYAPTYPVVNQSVLFDASISYDPDGLIVTYTWNFGDRNITTVEDPLIQHVFKNATIYDVTLTVTDNDGLTHTITKRITVYTTAVSVHDVAIISIEPESSWVFQGRTLNITVTVTNEGTDIETFNVSLYYDNTKIETFAVINLFPSKNLTLTFTWNTTNLYPAQYNISAAATIVPEETDTTDNTLVYGTIGVLWLGDINHDGKVDMRDIANIARGFGSHKGEPRYDPTCDLNNDGKIDMRDIAPAAKNFGKT